MSVLGLDWAMSVLGPRLGHVRSLLPDLAMSGLCCQTWPCPDSVSYGSTNVLFDTVSVKRVHPVSVCRRVPAEVGKQGGGVYPGSQEGQIWPEYGRNRANMA